MLPALSQKHAVSILRRVAFSALCLAAGLAVLWSFGALYIDAPRFPRVLAIGFLLVLGVLLWRLKGTRAKLWATGGAFLTVACWWLTLTPLQERHWQPDVARECRGEFQGNTLTIHNVRNFSYQPDGAMSPRWETRTFDLAKLTGIDLFINYWGSPWIAHPIASFQFSDGPPLALSIETRREADEEYSAIRGLYRQFELVLIAADERDVIGVRTRVRKGEDVYLYRTKASPAQAEKLLREYVDMMNRLADRPQWYQAITNNCTTALRAQMPRQERTPWDWRILLNGKSDEMIYERGEIETFGMSFAQLREHSHINALAKAAGESPNFSKIIRRVLGPAESSGASTAEPAPAHGLTIP